LFVHLGPKLPPHLLSNIERTQSLFPKENIVLVTDAHPVKAKLLPDDKIMHPNDIDWARNRAIIQRDQRFWDGWWQKTFDRLLMISPVHKLFPDHPIVHLESDSILFPSFPFDALRKESKIAYPMYSSNQAVASVVFSPDPKRSESLEREILRELSLNPSTSDMEALGAIATKLKLNFMRMPEFPEDREDPLFSPEAVLGFFDGASHGEWICGRDPRAHWGIGKRRQRTPISKQRHMHPYKLIGNQLYVIHESGTSPVHNLHVHSKEAEFFEINLGPRVASIVRNVSTSSNPRPTYFVPRAFLFSLLSNIRIWRSSIFMRSAWRRLLGRIHGFLSGGSNAK
jgi:hypothetical protein